MSATHLQHIIEEEECEGVAASTATVTQLSHVHLAHVHAVRRNKIGLEDDKLLILMFSVWKSHKI